LAKNLHFFSGLRDGGFLYIIESFFQFIRLIEVVKKRDFAIIIVVQLYLIFKVFIELLMLILNLLLLFFILSGNKLAIS